ncbi:MAG: stage 0 sporulation family protein [Nitrospiraceae bacterium]|jgi:cell fate regulator YaaT (PSP1 superfamily)|nr:stage 0 sporulation family protein [Nitrospiraceae bacterium]
MPDVVGVRFKSCGKIYDFEVNGIDIKEGDAVVIESDFGLGIGKVIRGRHFVESPERELKKVIRLVTEEDIKTVEENKKLGKDARDFCIERVMARGLQMKLVGAEATLDRKRIIFYFTADGRIDFRELVKDLAAKFKTRIEMRQIGVRDEAKLIGGLGICGRELCCSTFLTSFDPVSIKMAKKQELALNVGKLSGLCGRLMCCLRYEYDGDMESISADDEIPAEDEVTEERGKGGISAVLSKLEQNGDTSDEMPEDLSEKEGAVEAKKEEKTGKSEDRHNRFRHKRRRFRR